jgi:hypothetical protein
MMETEQEPPLLVDIVHFFFLNAYTEQVAKIQTLLNYSKNLTDFSVFVSISYIVS